MEDKRIENLSEVSSMYIREYSYSHGKEIYKFMDKYKIGKSDYGKLMDTIGKEKGVIAHRLYEHHLIFDFPYKNPENIPFFLEHELSDLFTKMGLPIIPSKILEDNQLIKYCDKLKKNWNFVNGFDILSGTVAIWNAIEKIDEAFNQNMSVDSFEDFSNTIGIGALELAISISSANPFLMIAAILHFTSGIRGLMNDSATIKFRNNINTLMIEFSMDSLNIKRYVEMYNINNTINNYNVNTIIGKYRIKGI